MSDREESPLGEGMTPEEALARVDAASALIATLPPGDETRRQCEELIGRVMATAAPALAARNARSTAGRKRGRDEFEDEGHAARGARAGEERQEEEGQGHAAEGARAEEDEEEEEEGAGEEPQRKSLAKWMKEVREAAGKPAERGAARQVRVIEYVRRVQQAAISAGSPPRVIVSVCQTELARELALAYTDEERHPATANAAVRAVMSQAFGGTVTDALDHLKSKLHQFSGRLTTYNVREFAALAWGLEQFGRSGEELGRELLRLTGATARLTVKAEVGQDEHYAGVAIALRRFIEERPKRGDRGGRGAGRGGRGAGRGRVDREGPPAHRGQNGAGRGSDNRTCYNCQQSGHIARNCPSSATVQNMATWGATQPPGQEGPGHAGPPSQAPDASGPANRNQYGTNSGINGRQGSREEEEYDKEAAIVLEELATSSGMRPTMIHREEGDEERAKVDEEAEYDALLALGEMLSRDYVRLSETMARSPEGWVRGTYPDRVAGMHFPMEVQKTPVVSLFDSGADKNFMAPEVVRRLNLTTYPANVDVFLGERSLRKKITQKVVAEVRAGDRTAMLVFYVFAIRHEVIIGTESAPRLGIEVTLPGAPIERDEPTEHEIWTAEKTATKQITGTLYDRLMEKIKNAIDENQRLPDGAVCSHPKIEFKIETGDEKPIYTPQYPIPRSVVEKVMERIEEWKRKGYIIRAPAGCKWNSPLLAAKKVSGGRVNWDDIRLCLDSRRVNGITKNPPNTIPRVKELLDKLSGFLLASSIDGQDAYHKIRLRKEDQVKTAFTAPDGSRWMFTVMIFGLKGAGPYFQEFMCEIVGDLIENVSAYIDDGIAITKGNGNREITEKIVDEHAELVSELIKRLTKYHFRLRLSKCVFGATKLRVLGFILEGTKKIVDGEKISNLDQIPRPETRKQLDAWFGLLNYLRDFIPGYAKLTKPLTEMRKYKKITKEMWTEERKEAFERVKEVLKRAPVLETVNFDEPLQLAVDASQYGIGWVLYQEYGDRRHYIVFGAKALNEAQTKYPANKRELFGVKTAVEKCHYWLYGVHFALYCDHKALSYVLDKASLPRVMNDWLHTISGYAFKIIHRPGIENVLPDNLSRLFDEISIRKKERTTTLQNTETPRKKKRKFTFTFANNNKEPEDNGSRDSIPIDDSSSSNQKK
mmetsp:Transcript_29514/g.82456  ORF Transcript_29514/g.82456 Transcript_29514/m.82456 type:complete len:1162 (+) Transcript_29514:71-3556(+)